MTDTVQVRGVMEPHQINGAQDRKWDNVNEFDPEMSPRLLPKKKTKPNVNTGTSKHIDYVTSSPISPRKSVNLTSKKLQNSQFNTSRYSQLGHSNQIDESVAMIRNRDSINTRHLDTLYDPTSKNPIRTFNEKQFTDGQQKNLAKFIDYRIDK